MIGNETRRDRLRAGVLIQSLDRHQRSAGAPHDLSELWDGLDDRIRDRLRDQIDQLERRGVDAISSEDSRYPTRLAAIGNPPPVLFVWGNSSLLGSPGVGMCGSRHVSEKGLQAARTCGLEVARRGLVIISGYARGVDTETHLAALDSGGRTVIILAEGILHFRQKKAFDAVGLDPDRVLVVSQFPPGQSWNVGAAMTRNALIAGLGRALVVVEAGETGGTLNAGLRALRLGRPVLALQFVDATPAGNKILFEKGAVPIRTAGHLGSMLESLEEMVSVEAKQLSMLSQPSIGSRAPGTSATERGASGESSTRDPYVVTRKRSPE